MSEKQSEVEKAAEVLYGARERYLSQSYARYERDAFLKGATWLLERARSLAVADAEKTQKEWFEKNGVILDTLVLPCHLRIEDLEALFR